MKKLILLIALSPLALLYNNSSFAAGCLPQIDSLTFVDKSWDVKLYKGRDCDMFVLGLKNTSRTKQYGCSISFDAKNERIYLDPNGIDTLLFKQKHQTSYFSFSCRVTKSPVWYDSPYFKKKIEASITYVSLKNEYHDRKMICNFLDDQNNLLAERIVIMPLRWSRWVANEYPTKHECREIVIK